MRRGISITLTTAACLIVIIVIAISPLALTGLEALRKDWGKLSDVGQAYGAISALISSLALVGIVWSLLYQARAGQTAREQSIRTFQQELIKMEMNDPALMTAMGAPWDLPIPADSARIREHLYIHMWASFWAGNYAVRELNARTLRRIARSELFNSRAGRAYWAAVRENVLSINERKYRRFARIVDKEYQKIIASGLPVADPVTIVDYPPSDRSHQRLDINNLAMVGIILLIGISISRKITQWIRRERRCHSRHHA